MAYSKLNLVPERQVALGILACDLTIASSIYDFGTSSKSD